MTWIQNGLIQRVLVSIRLTPSWVTQKAAQSSWHSFHCQRASNCRGGWRVFEGFDWASFGFNRGVANQRRIEFGMRRTIGGSVCSVLGILYEAASRGFVELLAGFVWGRALLSP